MVLHHQLQQGEVGGLDGRLVKERRAAVSVPLSQAADGRRPAVPPRQLTSHDGLVVVRTAARGGVEDAEEEHGRLQLLEQSLDVVARYVG